jgi:hypothetical protein
MRKLSEEDKHKIYAELLADKLDAIFESMPTATEVGHRFDLIDQRLERLEQGLEVIIGVVTAQGDDLDDHHRRLRHLEQAA